MKGLSDTVGVERGAVLALRAGRRRGPRRPRPRRGGGRGDSRCARRTASRRTGSARRPAAWRRVADWASSVTANGAAKRGRPRGCAPRARDRRRGEVDEAPLVVELRPRANIAAGEAEHSLGEVLAGRLPGTRTSCSTRWARRPRAARTSWSCETRTATPGCASSPSSSHPASSSRSACRSGGRTAPRTSPRTAAAASASRPWPRSVT